MVVAFKFFFTITSKVYTEVDILVAVESVMWVGEGWNRVLDMFSFNIINKILI